MVSTMHLASTLCHPLLLLQLVSFAASNPHMGKDVETMGALLGKAFLLRRSASFEDIPTEAPLFPPVQAPAPTGSPSSSVSQLLLDVLRLTTPAPPQPPAETQAQRLPSETQAQRLPSETQAQRLPSERLTPSPQPERQPTPSPFQRGEEPQFNGGVYVLPAQQPQPRPPPTVPPAGGAAAAWTTIASSMAEYGIRRSVSPEDDDGVYPHRPSVGSKYKYHDVLRREFAARNV